MLSLHSPSRVRPELHPDESVEFYTAARCLGDWSLRNSETIEAGQGAVGGRRIGISQFIQ